MPLLVKLCTHTWTHHHPDWQVTIVTDDTIHKYLPDTDVTFIRERGQFANYIQFRSDLVRLHLLALHGGVWADASILMTDTLEWMLQEQQRDPDIEYVGYYLRSFTMDERFPVIENWMFGCIPNASFVVKWKDAFCNMILEYESIDAYVAARLQDTDPQGLASQLPYLNMHLAAQHVLQHEHDTTLSQTLKLFPVEDGPMKYLHDYDWYGDIGLRHLLCSDDSNEKGLMQRIIKFRGTERIVMEKEQPQLLDCLLDRFRAWKMSVPGTPLETL